MGAIPPQEMKELVGKQLGTSEWVLVDQAMIENVCSAGVGNSLSEGEALQGPVLRDYPGRGVSARVLPIPVLRELESVANEVLEEEAARDSLFAEVLAAQREFRANYTHWKTVGFLPRDF